MRTTILGFFLLLCSFSCTDAYAQDSYVRVPSDTSSAYTVTMKDGSVLNGRILERTKAEIVFSDINLGKITLKTNQIKSIERVSDDTLAVTMKSGSKVVGKLLGKSDTVLLVESSTLGKLTIRMSEVKEMRLIDKKNISRKGDYRFPNPLGTKYFLFGPSAIVQRKDQGYFQNTYIAYNSVDFGLNDHVTVGGGVFGFVFPYVSAKAGVEVAGNFHMGAGGHLLVNPFFSEIGIPWAVYGALSLGNREKNASLGVVWGGGFGKRLERPIYSFSGQIRFGRRSAFITENYFYPVQQQGYNYVTGIAVSSITYYYAAAYTYGIRILGERTSWDVGFLGLSDFADVIPVGIPFVSYTLRF